MTLEDTSKERKEVERLFKIRSNYVQYPATLGDRIMITYNHLRFWHIRHTHHMAKTYIIRHYNIITVT